MTRRIADLRLADAMPWLLATALAALWLAFGPATPDLAAQVYRSGLFEREGFTVWNGFWFGGHHTPGYSIFFPPLGAAIGPRLVGALAAVVSALLFAHIARTHWGRDSPAVRLGALWFGAATATDLLIGRLTFSLGVALGLAVVLAMQQRRRRVATLLAAACTLGSPVAGLFLAMCAVAHWAVTRERLSLAVAAAALTPALILAFAFPEGGEQPFSIGGLVAIVAFSTMLVVLVPPREKAIRAATALYIAAALTAFVVASPMGGNASRLGAMFAGPVLLCAASGRIPRRTMALAAVPLALWQWYAPVRETVKGATDPSGEAAYFQPLLGFLEGRADAAARVEVPFTRLHWESVHVARRYPLARGWETQLDVKYNDLFHGRLARELTADAYRRWLREQGVRYVALPGVALDPSARAEAKVIAQRPAFLREVWRSENWRVFRVRGGGALASGAAEVVHLGPQSVDLRIRRPGVALVRVRFSPYWTIARGSGCLSRSPKGWTVVLVQVPQTMRIRNRFDPRRALRRGSHCTVGTG